MRKNIKGFTLVELLVVIAIIGILAGVVLVSMSSIRKRAHQSSSLQMASSALPGIVKCYIKGEYSGNGIEYPTPGGTSSACTGTTNILPPVPSHCIGGSWAIYFDSYIGFGGQLAGVLQLYCPYYGSWGEGNRYDIFCHYAGDKTGKCEICDYDEVAAAWTCN